MSFDVLALVTGGDLSSTGLVSGQFSLVQDTTGGLNNGVLSFALNSTFAETGTHNTNSFVFGSVPAASAPGGNLGGGTASTGSSNDTIIGITGINSSSGNSTVNTTAPAPNAGTQVVSGVTYNAFDLGTATLTVTGATTGSTNVSIAPRGGLGNLIKPQVAIIGGTVAQFRGDDAANVATGAPLTISAGGSFILGDLEGLGGFDASLTPLFFELLNDGDDAYIDNHPDFSANFMATYGMPLTHDDEGDVLDNGVANFSGQGGFDASNIPDWFNLLNGGTSLSPSAAALSVVPEPATLGLLVIPGLAMLGRRRRGAK